jgi:hypothetical protein
VEAALKGGFRTHAVLAAAVLTVGLIGGLAFTGKPPGLPVLGFKPSGIVSQPPQNIVRAEMRTGKDRIVWRRNQAGSWAFDRAGAGQVSSDLVAHLEAALNFMHVSAPTRVLEPSEYDARSLADFGLDPPAYLVALGAADRSVTIADFGTSNPSATAQYLRLGGGRQLYLMPRYVGAEWQLTADIARRMSPAQAPGQEGADRISNGAPELLLPASLDQIWAAEVVFGGKLHRFERDGGGNWFLHLGQHTHAANANAHVADPAQARVIKAALAAFDETQIDRLVTQASGSSQLEKYGLSRPSVIAMFYARDNSVPVARVDIGNVAEDGFGRYARLGGSTDVVAIAGYEAGRLIELLKAVGAAS